MSSMHLMCVPCMSLGLQWTLPLTYMESVNSLLWQRRSQIMQAHSVTDTHTGDACSRAFAGGGARQSKNALAQEEPDDEVYRPPPAGGRLDEKGKDIPVQIKMQ
eukprot:scaffold278724_cov18-Tisochrysis_lutea.AAC.1